MRSRVNFVSLIDYRYFSKALWHKNSVDQRKGQLFQDQAIRGSKATRIRKFFERKAARCKFEDLKTKDAVVVQFVNGINDDTIKAKLLAKEKLSLEEAVEFYEIELDMRQELAG